MLALLGLELYSGLKIESKMPRVRQVGLGASVEEDDRG